MAKEPNALNLYEQWRSSLFSHQRYFTTMSCLDDMSNERLIEAWQSFIPVITAYKLNPDYRNGQSEMLILGYFHGLFLKRGLPIELIAP